MCVCVITKGGVFLFVCFLESELFCAMTFLKTKLAFSSIEFHIIVCGLDSVIARRWINGMLVKTLVLLQFFEILAAAFNIPQIRKPYHIFDKSEFNFQLNRCTS